MLRALATNLKRKLGAGTPWQIMAPIAVAHVLMLATAAFGLHAIASEADRSDAQRAREAVSAAFNYQLGRLEMVTANNAVYTEAWKAVGGARVDTKWAVENWTVAPPGLPGHYGILLLEPGGRPIIGTRGGRPMPERTMQEMARWVRPVVQSLPAQGEASIKGLITTTPTPLLIAAANVVPEEADRTPESMRGPKRQLVLVHPINAQLLATMNETIGGEQLRLSSVDRSVHQVVLTPHAGVPVALSWRSREPGRAAMIRSVQIIGPILLLVSAFLIFAMRAGLASSRALRQAALLDPLTGLANRAAFAAELERRLGHGSGFAVGLIDLDRFKHVNDTYGHPAGDHLLKAIGDILMSIAAPGDLVARLGGDEFAFLTPSRELADRIALRLQLELARPVELQGLQLVASASVGIAVAQMGAVPSVIIAEADAELYANKRRRAAQPESRQTPGIGERARVEAQQQRYDRSNLR